MRRVLSLALALAACGQAEVPASGPDFAAPAIGQTAVMGAITGFVAGAPAQWDIVDRVAPGGIAAAAVLPEATGARLLLTGTPAFSDGAPEGSVEVATLLPAGPVPGPGIGTTVVLRLSADPLGAAYRSTGQPLLNVSTVTRTPGEPRARISGTFVGTLCRTDAPGAAPDFTDCRDIAAEFDTFADSPGI